MTQADKTWNEKLNKMMIDADERTKRIFYTALYHTMIAPSEFCDVNKDYFGTDKAVHPQAGFTNQKGVEDRRVKLGCAVPGDPVSVFGDALRRLVGAATYLYQDGVRYWYYVCFHYGPAPVPDGYHSIQNARILSFFWIKFHSYYQY